MSYYESPSDLYGKSFGSGSPDDATKLRPDLVVREHVHKQEVFYIIKDPVAQLYYNFPPLDWRILSLFDGTRTDAQVIEEYNRANPSEILDEEALAAYKQGFKSMDLFVTSTREKSLMLMERIREQRKLRKKATEGNLFYMTFSAWDPDRHFNRIIPYIRFLWSRPFFIFSVFCIVGMLAINWLKWDEFTQGTIELYTFTEKSFWDILVFIFLMTATGTMHELGHGLTLKHFGGEVHQMGFLLFYLTPAFYADVSDSYLLPRRERIWTTLAGTYTELIICSFASFVWFFAVPGTQIYDLAFQVILFTGISSFLINMNPLIKLDGYYLLMDTLEVPDLREEAFEYLKRRIKGGIFRLQVDEPEGISKRKKRIYIAYGIAAILYTLLLYLVIVLWLKNVYLNTFKQFGYVLLIATLYMLFRKELRESIKFLRFAYLDKKEVFMARKPVLWIAIGSAILLFLLFIPRTHTKIESAFVIEPVEKVEVRAGIDGFLRAVSVKEGDRVKAGQVLGKMGNPDLIRDAFAVDSELRAIERSIYAVAADSADQQMNVRKQEQLEEKKSNLQWKLNQLDLRTAIDGLVMTPYVDEKKGSYLKTGQTFCEVGNVQRVKIQIPVREYEIEDVKPGHEAVLKLDAYPTETFRGKVVQISSAVSERVSAIQGSYSRFLVTAVIENADGRLIPGMQGDAKILAQKYSVGRRVGRELYRWVRSKIW